MKNTEHSLLRSTAGAVKGTGGTISGLVVAVVVGFGIPLVWIWIASKLAGDSRDVTPSLALVITTGILVSYWLALLVGSHVRRRFVDEEEDLARHRRRSWNRSFRDEPLHTDKESDPVERLFVVVAVLGVIAFEIWFFFFAGSPLPSQPLF
jgi:Mg2+/citrate symporter